MARMNTSITINAKVTVSAEQAERCMRILEMFLDDNPDISIICERKLVKYESETIEKHYLSFKKIG